MAKSDRVHMRQPKMEPKCCVHFLITTLYKAVTREESPSNGCAEKNVEGRHKHRLLSLAAAPMSVASSMEKQVRLCKLCKLCSRSA